MQKSILIISHGSKSSQIIKEVESLAQRVKAKINIGIVEFGFLELISPSIEEGFVSCIKQGASHVFILLNFLNSGKHVDDDIPSIIEGLKELYPDVEVKLSIPIGQHEGIIDLFMDLLEN